MWGSEISQWKECRATSEQNPYQVNFKTNNIEPKHPNWYNNGDFVLDLEISGDKTVSYVIGIELVDSSFKSKTTIKGYPAYEYEWIYDESIFSG